MMSFGTEEYGNKDAFRIKCCKCGSEEARIVPIHHFENRDYVHPVKIVLEVRCTCGNKFGAIIHDMKKPLPANYDESKGFTVTYVRDDDGIRRVATRCKSTKELNEFLDKISTPNSGWSEEELQSLKVVNDINYIVVL